MREHAVMKEKKRVKGTIIALSIPMAAQLPGRKTKQPGTGYKAKM